MKKMKKMSEREMKKLMDEFDEVAPPVDELSGYERVDAWVEWLKGRLECPTIEQLPHKAEVSLQTRFPVVLLGLANCCHP